MEANKKTKALGVGVAAAVLVAGGAYVAYAKFDLFKSPRMMYLEAEAQSMSEVSKKLDKASKEYNEAIDASVKGTTSQDIEISNLILDMAMPDPQIQKALDLAKDSKIVISSSADGPNNKGAGKLDIFINKSNLVGAEFFYDKEKLGFGVPAIYNKYGYYNYKDKAIVEQRFGQMGLPDHVPNNKEYMEVFRIPNEELKPILADYAKLYAESIKDQQVTVKKGATLEADGVKQSGKELTVTFTAEEYKQLMKKFTDKISKDEKLQDLLYARYDKLVELMKQNAPDESIPKLTKEEFKKKFSEFKTEADREIDKKDAGSGVKMVVFVDSDDHILRRTITTDNKSKDKNVIITIDSYENKDGRDRNSFEFVGKDAKGEDIKINITNLMKEESSKKDQEFTVWAKGKENGRPSGMTLSVKGTTTKNDKDKSTTEDAKVELAMDMNDPTIPKKLTFNMKSTQKLNGEVKIPALDAGNSVNLAIVTDADLMKIQQEIQLGGQQFMIKNMQLFQQLGLMPGMPTGQ
ncbi:hypothetical protein DFP93_11451 [Aneurinibacillus soli]|uniref:Uncharacterized protein n=1 Tax=Aneurinibacillus soli TaxID=1500254 RepID=A0A0U4WC45_9BACL|nr:DUF6583 family protein [Aneurinibacillus soli]PYE60116.1 hypothetical protein DFP93_11451 [Aneurinibacillus soli]BAU26395.1 hypothetical protein CB4_00522 [Aneurinibacillus soli]